jgi:Dolichyl-phosphate-mannose-protein mannosyltransferase
VKQPIRQPKQSRKTTRSRRGVRGRQNGEREQRSSLDAIIRLDRSAIVSMILLYCVIHWAIRVLVAPVYTVEEAGQLLFSQSFQFGYEARQPPMLSWLYWVATRAGGISPPVIFAVKYALLFIGLAFYYLSARNILVRPGVSAAALAAWALTFQIGWSAHEDLLSGVALMAVLSLSLHAITRILTWRAWSDWFYLGVAMGLGLLTHHLFIVFPIAMLIGVMLSPFFRDALSFGRLFLMVLVAALIYAPYVMWVATHIDSVGDAAREYIASWEIDGAWLERAGNAAAQLGRALLEFALPLLLFWMMLFWTLWLPIIYPIFPRRNTDEEPHELAWRKLFVQAAILGVGAYMVSVPLGVQAYKPHWMMPVLFGLPIWLFAHVKRAGDFPVAIRGFGAVVAAFVVLVAGGRFVEAQLEIGQCREGGCRPYTPIASWASALREAGFQQGTIVGADLHLTGNLRAAFPRARVIDASVATEAYPPRQGNGACLIVWRDTRFNDTLNVALMPDELSTYMEQELKARLRDKGARGAVRRPLRMSEDKAATLYFQLNRASGQCG